MNWILLNFTGLTCHLNWCTLTVSVFPDDVIYECLKLIKRSSWCEKCSPADVRRLTLIDSVITMCLSEPVHQWSYWCVYHCDQQWKQLVSLSLVFNVTETCCRFLSFVSLLMDCMWLCVGASSSCCLCLSPALCWCVSTATACSPGDFIRALWETKCIIFQRPQALD